MITTKDSESWDGIAIPTFIFEVLPGVVAYRLALIRPFSDKIEGEFLFRAFSSDLVADRSHQSEVRRDQSSVFNGRAGDRIDERIPTRLISDVVIG